MILTQVTNILSCDSPALLPLRNTSPVLLNQIKQSSHKNGRKLFYPSLILPLDPNSHKQPLKKTRRRKRQWPADDSGTSWGLYQHQPLLSLGSTVWALWLTSNSSWLFPTHKSTTWSTVMKSIQIDNPLTEEAFQNCAWELRDVCWASYLNDCFIKIK